MNNSPGLKFSIDVLLYSFLKVWIDFTVSKVNLTQSEEQVQVYTYI